MLEGFLGPSDSAGDQAAAGEGVKMKAGKLSLSVNPVSCFLQNTASAATLPGGIPMAQEGSGGLRRARSPLVPCQEQLTGRV